MAVIPVTTKVTVQLEFAGIVMLLKFSTVVTLVSVDGLTFRHVPPTV